MNRLDEYDSMLFQQKYYPAFTQGQAGNQIVPEVEERKDSTDGQKLSYSDMALEAWEQIMGGNGGAYLVQQKIKLLEQKKENDILPLFLEGLASLEQQIPLEAFEKLEQRFLDGGDIMNEICEALEIQWRTIALQRQQSEQEMLDIQEKLRESHNRAIRAEEQIVKTAQEALNREQKEYDDRIGKNSGRKVRWWE